MKNPLVLALLILAVLGGAVWYTNENPPAGDEESVSLVDVKEDQIAAITVRKAGAEPLTVTRAEGETDWKFGGGLSYPADNAAIGLMVTNLSSLDADRVVEEQTTDWAPYGLEGDGEISVDVTFRKGEAKEAPAAKKIVFGRETPTGSGAYARIDGDPRLFTVYNYVKTTFDKKPFDWRDKKLLQVEEDSVSRLELDLKDRAFAFDKSEDKKWRIQEPSRLRADNFTVGDLARSIEGAQMTAEVEGDGFSFDRPLASAEVEDAKGSHTLKVIRDGERYLAQSSDQQGVYEVSATFAESLQKNLADFREKKLFDFGFEPLAKISLRDGATSAAIEKKADKWALTTDGDREVGSEKAQTLIDALRNLSATAFPTDEAGQFGRYGLASPALEAGIVAAGEGATTEKLLISDLGKERVYAARDGEASVYEIEKSAAEEIRRALESLLAADEKPAEESGTPPEEGR
ncbi:MAG: DUF4340 domain-containing protein [Acidobacteria bacterium]|nr:DUF4340 domain-containing protein [Acidobacteriota bacterium]